MVMKPAALWTILAIVVAALAFSPDESFAGEKAAKPVLSAALGRVSLFSGLTAKERGALESAVTLRQCRQGERIIERGKPLDRMFILLESQGEVKINGKTVAILPEQSLIGEIEFLDGRPASAEVILSGESPVIEIDNAALTRLMEKQPRLGYVLMGEIARIEGKRLRAMDERPGN